MIEYFAIHRVDLVGYFAGCKMVLLRSIIQDFIGCKMVLWLLAFIEYFESRCNASGRRMDQDEQIEEKQCRSVHRMEGRTADVKPSTSEAVIGSCQLWVLIR
jgi:hypothetical protein